ncbi:MAG: hypothetical protein ACJ739_02635, partial [Acidimicrobiales bacterium]
MNTITEPRQDISSSEAMDSTDSAGSGAKPKTGRGELWLAILALVAIVALVAAAFGAFESSSST